MTQDQMERLVAAFETIAKVMQERYDRDFPEPEPIEEAQVSFRGERTPEPQTKEEYDSFTEGAGRFQSLIKAAGGKTSVKGTAAYNAMTKLGVDLDQLRKSPDISNILARSVGPRQRVIDALRFSSDPAAIDFLNIFDELPKGDRINVPFEVVCIAGQINPAQVLGACLMAAKIVGAQESMLTTAIEHPELVRKTFQYAKELPGAHADRRMLLEASGYLPNSKGGGVNVNVLSGNPQLADSQDDAGGAFETAFPSIGKDLEQWGERRRKLVLDVGK